MTLPRTIKAYLAWINGSPMIGKVAEFDPPELKEKEADYRAGEMVGEIAVSLGIDKMESSIVFEEIPEEALNTFGICKHNEVRLRVTASEESEDCDFSQQEWMLVGRWNSIKPDKLKAGDMTKCTCKLRVAEFTESRNGKELVFIDVAKGIWRSGGEDRTAERRKALGLPY